VHFTTTGGCLPPSSIITASIANYAFMTMGGSVPPFYF
jgi:hypothetical protein